MIGQGHIWVGLGLYCSLKKIGKCLVGSHDLDPKKTNFA